MTESETRVHGHVYILAVKDIDLPVCKVGMTTRSPYARCDEINKSSTGDFLWEVAYHIAVDNCKKLESLFLTKLEPLRQKRREFVNISADDAFTALKSILVQLHDVKEVSLIVSKNLPPEHLEPRMPKKKSKLQFTNVDPKNIEILGSFASILNVKGRMFGQRNKRFFGMSDGKDGVQWNISIYPDDIHAHAPQLGVNLEGMEYVDWPISKFILSELRNPGINDVKEKLRDTDNIFVRFKRDAWQVQSRPDIVEEYLAVGETPLTEMDAKLWSTILNAALGCLSKGHGYRGRAEQQVTLAGQTKEAARIQKMWVSPHLTIWTPVELLENTTDSLKAAFQRLYPVHEWVSRASQSQL